MAFERIEGERKVLFVVSKNPRDGRDYFSLKNLQMPDGVYRDELNGKSYEVRNGNMDVALAYGDVIVIAR